jgi:hypothetical protein
LASSAELIAQLKPKIIKSSEFVLTDEQAATGIDGSIRIVLDVDKEGVVTDAEIVAGPIWPCDNSAKKHVDAFKSAAIKNAKGFLFEPLGENQTRYESKITLTVTVGPAFLASEKAKANPPSDAKVIDGGVVNGRAIKLARPRFPAIVDPYETFVVVQVLIDETGRVASAGTLFGPPDYHKVSRNAACDSAFTPTLLKGKPVKVSGTIRYDFVKGDPPPQQPRIGPYRL